MPRRRALTEAQLEGLVALPAVEADLFRHWTLVPSYLPPVERRRGGHNQLGYALQLCAFRFSGRVRRFRKRLWASSPASFALVPMLSLHMRSDKQGHRSLRLSFSTSSLPPCTIRTPRFTCVSGLKAPPAPAHRLVIVRFHDTHSCLVETLRAQSLNGSNSPSPAIATANGRSVCNTRMDPACCASTSGSLR